MSENAHTPLESLSYRKSNDFVSAKYKSSLLENQLIAIALTRIESNSNDANAPLRARLYPSELKRLIGDPTHIYSRLKTVSKSMTGHSIIIEDNKGNFKAMSIVTNADYEDGILTIKLNNDLREHILGLEKRYTTLTLSIMTGFKRDSTFRLYEIFKSNIYKSNKNVNNGRVDLEYNLSELRFMIGLANADSPQVQQERARMGNNIDWDKLYRKLDKKDKVYERWSELERNVLRPAKNEMAEKSDIRVEYEGIREGRSIRRVRFSIYPNHPEEEKEISRRKKILEKNKKKEESTAAVKVNSEALIAETIYEELIGHNGLTKEDITCLLKKAGQDENNVRDAVAAADQQPSIKNYMGWIISYLENGGYESTPVMNGSKEKAESYNDLSKEIHSDDFAESVWQRMKKREDFPEFVSSLKKYGISTDALELTYTPTERTNLYIAWKKHEPMPF